ncbi:MAG TPA: diguanylate cyclase [Anaeromyxobacteraceae bacterium]|jgi:diguanylate cyclase (GGDEF)-like protein
MQGRILVVEHSRAQAELIAAPLLAAGYQVAHAQEGGAALASIKASPPDAVLLALKGLPDLSGSDVLRAAKSWASRSELTLPVIVVSAATEIADRVEALTRLYADDYLTKPFAEAEILARVQVQLRIKSLQDDLRAAQRELERLSITDGLTGINNHRHFQARLREEVSRAQRYGSPLSLVMLDLDHFKEVNDRWGHPFGDQVLRGTAELIRQALRDVDLCARYGGEEFAVLLPETPPQGAVLVARRIRRQVSERVYALDGARGSGGGSPKELQVTCSAGVASYPSPGATTPETLVRRADEALYQAKESGRNAVFSWNGNRFERAVEGDG